MSVQAFCLAYIGPETILPATSVLAGIGGVLLLFGRKVFGWAASLFRLVFRRCITSRDS